MPSINRGRHWPLRCFTSTGAAWGSRYVWFGSTSAFLTGSGYVKLKASFLLNFWADILDQWRVLFFDYSADVGQLSFHLQELDTSHPLSEFDMLVDARLLTHVEVAPKQLQILVWELLAEEKVGRIVLVELDLAFENLRLRYHLIEQFD